MEGLLLSARQTLFTGLLHCYNEDAVKRFDAVNSEVLQVERKLGEMKASWAGFAEFHSREYFEEFAVILIKGVSVMI